MFVFCVRVCVGVCVGVCVCVCVSVFVFVFVFVFVLCVCVFVYERWWSLCITWAARSRLSWHKIPGLLDFTSSKGEKVQCCLSPSTARHAAIRV